MDGVGVDWLAADAAANRSTLAPARTALYARGALPAGTASAQTRSANSTSARRSLPAVRVALTETQTGLPTTRQARQASYEKGCNTGWHLEHGGLRVFDSSNLRAKPRTAAVETIFAQPRGYESWRHARRQPWAQLGLRFLRVRERLVAQRMHAALSARALLLPLSSAAHRSLAPRVPH